jgi:hypothetical protein
MAEIMAKIAGTMFVGAFLIAAAVSTAPAAAADLAANLAAKSVRTTPRTNLACRVVTPAASMVRRRGAARQVAFAPVLPVRRDVRVAYSSRVSLMLGVAY